MKERPLDKLPTFYQVVYTCFMGDMRCRLRRHLKYAWKRSPDTFKGAAVKIWRVPTLGCGLSRKGRVRLGDLPAQHTQRAL
jgi:hypothetical protein